MSPTVELVYDKACPNVAATRTNLLRAFAEAGVSAKWTEWEESCPETPARLHGFGSPTVLIEGKDVAGAQPVEGLTSCRLYDGKDEQRGVPPVELIALALSKAHEQIASNLSTVSRSKGRVSAKAKTYGIRSVPAVVIDGKLADCCAGRGPEEASLRAAGVGRPLL